MKKEEAKELCDNALEQLAKALANGKSTELERYLRVMSTFHNYSFGNCLLILQQRPTATRVAGFSAWKKVGRSVKKGEKGICILAPMIRKAEAEDSDSDKEVFGYRAVHVFDVSQTSGEALPDVSRVTGDPGERLGALIRFTESHGISVSFDEHLGLADGVSKIGAIAIDPNLPVGERFSVIVHELAHELLHTREDRKTLSHSVKELEAESVAFVVAQSVELDNALAASTDYIQSCGGDAALLASSLARIQGAADKIISGLGAESMSTLT